MLITVDTGFVTNKFTVSTVAIVPDTDLVSVTLVF